MKNIVVLLFAFVAMFATQAAACVPLQPPGVVIPPAAENPPATTQPPPDCPRGEMKNRDGECERTDLVMAGDIHKLTNILAHQQGTRTP